MRDHYIFFSPLDLTRDTALRAAHSILREYGAVPTLECEELTYDTEQQRHRWTGEFTTCGTIEEVAALTHKWSGIATYFEFTENDVLGSLSILLWNDTPTSPVTLTLCEDSTLFNLQREHAMPWTHFQEIVISLADSLGSSFCLMKTNPPLRTVSEESISGILAQIERGQQIPLLLAVHAGRFPAARSALTQTSVRLSRRRQLGYVVFTDTRMGSAELEDV